MKVLNTIRTIRQELHNMWRDIRTPSTIALDQNESKILEQIRSTGFYIIPDFYSREECDELRNEIDLLSTKYRGRLFVDSQDADHRIYGADRLSPKIGKFYKDRLINQIVNAHEKPKKLVGFTLAARLEYHPGNTKGSGDGWHRDRTVDKQIKAIIYLSDVDISNGPFQYIRESHRHSSIVRECYAENFDFNQARFKDEQIERLIRKRPEKLLTLLSKAGSLILVNTRGIHRGMPIKNGVRYALTNYYWSDMEMPSHLAKMIIQNEEQ